MNGEPISKPLFWVASSRRDLKRFPVEVRKTLLCGRHRMAANILMPNRLRVSAAQAFWKSSKMRMAAPTGRFTQLSLLGWFTFYILSKRNRNAAQEPRKLIYK
jgi:phage-related protein